MIRPLRSTEPRAFGRDLCLLALISNFVVSALCLSMPVATAQWDGVGTPPAAFLCGPSEADAGDPTDIERTQSACQLCFAASFIMLFAEGALVMRFRQKQAQHWHLKRAEAIAFHIAQSPWFSRAPPAFQTI